MMDFTFRIVDDDFCYSARDMNIMYAFAELPACVHAADDAEHAGVAADEPGAGRAAGQDPRDELPGAAGQAALGAAAAGRRGPGLGGGHRRGEGTHHED